MSRWHDDPERTASAYLQGELTHRRRRRFEEHLVGCDDCWLEVQLGREGRRIAEGSRELAPTRLRERLRTVIAHAAVTTPPRRPVRRALALGTIVVILGVGAWFATPRVESPPSVPPAIAAAVSAFQGDQIFAGRPEHRPPPLTQLNASLTSSGRTELGGTEVDVYAYQDPSGDRVVVFVSARPFPTPPGASQAGGMSAGWTASRDGVSLICGSRPMSYLLVGTDRALLGDVDELMPRLLGGRTS